MLFFEYYLAEGKCEVLLQISPVIFFEVFPERHLPVAHYIQVSYVKFSVYKSFTTEAFHTAKSIYFNKNVCIVYNAIDTAIENVQNVGLHVI